MSTIERLKVAIDEMKANIQQINVEVAEGRGTMETLEKLSNDPQFKMLARLTTGTVKGLQARMEDDLLIVTGLYKILEEIDRRQSQTDSLIHTILGIEGEVTDGEVLERAGDLGDMFNDIRERAGSGDIDR